MILTDLLIPWLTQRWEVSISRSAKDNVFIVGSRSCFIAKIYEDRVDVRTVGVNKCICCSSLKTLYACDPNFLPRLEADINKIYD